MEIELGVVDKEKKKIPLPPSLIQLSVHICRIEKERSLDYTVSGGALHMQRKIWAAADFQNFLARRNTRGLRVFGRARKF